MSLKDNFDYDPNSLDFKDALSFILKNIPLPNPNEAFDINAPDSLNYVLAQDVLSPLIFQDLIIQLWMDMDLILKALNMKHLK